MDTKAKQAVVDSLRELIESIEQDRINSATFSMWRNLLMPKNPGKLVDGATAPEPDATVSGCYVLKDGMQPVSPRDPDFLQHYDDVGNFPDANMSQKKHLTKLISAFGGWSKSLM